MMAVVFRMPLVFAEKNNDKNDVNQKFNKSGYVALIAAIETHYVHLDMLFFSDWDFWELPVVNNGKANNVVSTHSFLFGPASPGGPCAGTTSSSF